MVEGRFERPREGNVDSAGRQRFHLLWRAHFTKRKFDVGLELTVLADDPREEASSAPQKEADAKGTDLAEKGTIRNLDGTVGGEQCFARCDEKKLTMRRETGAA